MVKGYCDNKNSYYFGTLVSSDFFAEECGKKCGNCIYFYSPKIDPYVQFPLTLLERLRTIDTKIELLKTIDSDLFREEIEKLMEERKIIKETLDEFRRDLVNSL